LKPFLFVGLGNIGAKYANTRHNVGFDVVDAIAEEFNCVWAENRLAYVTDFRFRGKTIKMIKPTTYMNLSGRAFRFWMTECKVPLQNTLTIVDDLALPYGKIRMKGKGSHAGHNGLKNIEEALGTNAFPRLRFGIGDDFRKGQQVEYVLGNWTNKEHDELGSYLHDAQKAALSFVAHGLANTMNEFN